MTGFLSTIWVWVVVLCAATAFGQTAGSSESEVIFKDGRRVSGVLIEETAEKVVLSIGGIATTFKMDVVDRIQTLPSVEERYKVLRSTIDPEDTEGLMRLSEWLRAHGRFDLALIEVERALKIEPANPDARALKTLITEQQKIAAEAASPHATIKTTTRTAPMPKEAEFPLLTPEQINVIRVFEVDLKDPPRLLIGRDTISHLLDKYAGTNVEGHGTVPTTPEGRALFHKKSPAEILDWMFRLQAREFYKEVTVQDNPKAMQKFRDGVNRTWLINSCATSKCHGGEEAGRLWLYNKRQGSDQAAYTNFLILDRFKLANGMPLINYAEPARSPLLQLGLARDESLFKHPEIKGLNKGKWAPVFRSTEDERFKEAVDWIRSMYEKRTDYPIDYTAPVPNPKMPGVPEEQVMPAVEPVVRR
jgi:hypothetical protein